MNAGKHEENGSAAVAAPRMAGEQLRWNHGDAIDGIFVMPRADNPREFCSEVRPAKVIGFSHDACAARNWGWMGSVLVEFGCGRKSWQGLSPKAAS